MNSFLRREWLQVLILALPFIILPLAWPYFPERVPTHWNASGEINGWMMKGTGFFFTMLILPAINVGLALLLGSLAKIDPKFATVNVSSESIRPVRLIVTTFLMILFLLIVATSAGMSIDMKRAPEIIIFLLFFVLGIYIPRVKPNYFVGIRDPWTLEDPEIWRKTHVFAGKIWPIASVIGIITEILYPSVAILFGFIAIVAIVPIVYSFLQFREKKKQGAQV
jgi:uncharacterized membrane protein